MTDRFINLTPLKITLIASIIGGKQTIFNIYFSLFEFLSVKFASQSNLDRSQSYPIKRQVEKPALISSSKRRK